MLKASRSLYSAKFFILLAFLMQNTIISIYAESPSPSIDKVNASPASMTPPTIYGPEQNAEQRELFQAASQLLRQGDISGFKAKQQQLQDYVLAPYLERDYLLDRISLKNRQAIIAFLEKYADQPVTIRVRSKFLHLLARKDQTFLFLTHYRPTGDITLQCHWLRFRFKTNEDRQTILEHAKQLWRYGHSRPDACDPVFQQLKLANQLTDELIWERLILALDAGNQGLARYLTSKLSKPLQATGQYAQSVIVNPNRLTKDLPSDINQTLIASIAHIVVRKKVWSNPELAVNLYQNKSPALNFSDAQEQQIAQTFALALASKNHPLAAHWLAKVDYQNADELVLRWKLAHELRQGNWQALREWLAQTPPPANAENDWLYWQARVEGELGNHAGSLELLKALAQRRSYYGFLASARLGQAPNLASAPYPFDNAQIQSLSYLPGAQRAFELWQLNRFLSARREWNKLRQQQDSLGKKHLTALAHHWGWHEQVIFGSSRSGLHDNVAMRFPVAYQGELNQAAKDAEIDVTFPLAIARKESAFMPDARSRVGAIGLMQLMPYTARYIANKAQLPEPSKGQLIDPQTNVQLGTRYLKYLMDYYDGNQVLAAASYNAGRHKVVGWLPQDGTVPVDIWIETMPYKETRNYVKNVLAYQQIYRSLMGKPENYFAQLVAMEIARPGQD
ncbi:MAG: transglycosylase SLT domain-containing protein [Gammaproteobacteria bacterium]|nr:transglycosylase SLT domain-containing protein [Gammaproteobacteria bacterium]NVK87800.1 transglycosylase SLT domain-containing protein [Gammaproteobacteria bacterium]